MPPGPSLGPEARPKLSDVGQVTLRGASPTWFSAITCAIWLRLIFRGRGSACFFGAHLLFFHAREWILEAGVGFWIPEVGILARGRFWSDFGLLKKIVLQRNDFVREVGESILPK